MVIFTILNPAKVITIMALWHFTHQKCQVYTRSVVRGIFKTNQVAARNHAGMKGLLAELLTSELSMENDVRAARELNIARGTSDGFPSREKPRATSQADSRLNLTPRSSHQRKKGPAMSGMCPSALNSLTSTKEALEAGHGPNKALAG